MSIAIWEKRAFSVDVPPNATNGLLVVVTDNHGNEPRVQRVTGNPGQNVGFDVISPPGANVTVSVWPVDSNNQLGGVANYSYNAGSPPGNTADPVNAATIAQNPAGWVLLS